MISLWPASAADALRYATEFAGQPQLLESPGCTRGYPNVTLALAHALA